MFNNFQWFKEELFFFSNNLWLLFNMLIRLANKNLIWIT